MAYVSPRIAGYSTPLGDSALDEPVEVDFDELVELIWLTDRDAGIDTFAGWAEWAVIHAPAALDALYARFVAVAQDGASTERRQLYMSDALQ